MFPGLNTGLVGCDALPLAIASKMAQPSFRYSRSRFSVPHSSEVYMMLLESASGYIEDGSPTLSNLQSNTSAVGALYLLQLGREREEKISFDLRKTEVTFPPGDLVIPRPEDMYKQQSSEDYVRVQSFNPKGRLATVLKKNLAPLSEKQFQLLSTVLSSSDRYAAYQNKHLNEAENYGVSSKVLVNLSSNPEEFDTPGIIRHMGKVEISSCGIMFGVELLVR